MSERENQAQKDSFWDLSSLMPPAKPARTAPRQTVDTDPVEVVSPPPVGAAPKPYRVEDVVLTEHYVTPPAGREKKADQPFLTYRPTGSLLHEVRVYEWRAQYDYYERFAAQVRRLWTREGTECPIVPFFAYMPQYTQMTEAQLATYFWWRSRFRAGEYLSVDFSYLLLALYEMINVGKAAAPELVREQMTALWLAYRAQHPRLDSLIREWLCDHCLTHGLSSPDLPQADYRALLSGARLKEFYLPLSEDEERLLGGVMLFCNNYDYTKSKFFTPDTAADYHRVLRGAVRVALTVLRERDGNALTGGSGISTVTRDTFTGAICSYRLRRRIEVDYTSFSHTHELRYIVSDVLKYAENALRANRGIKSKLTVYAVDVAMRERLDRYLAKALPPRVKKTAERQEIAPYERRYDLPVTPISPARAAEIEAASWQTTKRLVDAFAEEQIGVSEAPFALTAPLTPPSSDPDGSRGIAEALGELCAFVRLAASGADKASQRRFADEKGMLLDAVADRVNTLAGDLLGDIVLELGESGYALIEDYRELLQEEGVL